MKKITKTAAVLAAIFAISTATAFSYGDISVRLDGVVSEDSEYVEFDDIKPVQLDSRTLIPARSVSESAGLSVTWDQPTQTALITLAADPYSYLPIERYAAELISQVNPPAPGLTPIDITAALRLGSDEAVIRYNYYDEEGDYVALGTTYKMVSKAIIVDNGTLMIPIRDSMEMFNLIVGWNQEKLCAYVSIPMTPRAHDDLHFISLNGEGEYAPTDFNFSEYESYSYEDLLNGGDGTNRGEEEEEESYAPDTSGMNVGDYIGTFKITHYCPCNICNGSWGAGTAWAGGIIPGQTIAINTAHISPLEWVYIDGYGFRHAEDTGGGLAEMQIDMAVPTHAMALSMGVVYRDVYRTR